MHISGYIHTLSPIHIADSTESNLTRIATFPVYEIASGRPANVPGIKSTLLRGLLRKVASDFVFDHLLQRGIRVPLELYIALRHGGDAGRRTIASARPELFDVAAGHPIMGLFGGGPRCASGTLRVPWMLPLCIETVASKLVPGHPDVEKLPYARQLIKIETIYPKLDILHGADFKYESIIENFDSGTDEIISADMARRLRKAAAPDADSGNDNAEAESKLRSSNLVSFEFLVPGVLLYLNISVNETAPDHIKGFLLYILAKALNENRIGGLQRIGHGVDTFNLPSAAANLKLPDDEPVFDWDGERLTIVQGGKSAQLAAAFDAWHRDGEAWTRESLWEASGFSSIEFSDSSAKKAKNVGGAAE